MVSSQCPVCDSQLKKLGKLLFALVDGADLLISRPSRGHKKDSQKHYYSRCCAYGWLPLYGDLWWFFFNDSTFKGPSMDRHFKSCVF